MSDPAAERGEKTSSITSVTEEDTSLDSESDTTESTSSVITSSVVSSTDTDEKLTPCLHKFSISSPNAGSRRKSRSQSHHHGGPGPLPHRSLLNAFNTPLPFQVPQYAYGSNPLPLHSNHQQVFHSRKQNRQKQRGLLQTVLRGNTNRQSHNLKGSRRVRTTHLGAFVRSPVSGRAIYARENLGVTDADNRLSTDLSDNSSVGTGEEIQSVAGDDLLSCADGDNLNPNNSAGSGSVADKDVDAGVGSTPFDNRPSFPDMNSSTWHQAKCFDHYWRHYSFVMEWYQHHVKAVETLTQQRWQQGWAGSAWGSQDANSHGCSNTRPSSRRTESQRRSRRARRAKNRRKAKNRQREKAAASLMISPHHENQAENGGVEEEGEEDVEMEITEEMVQFFATSLKHRMERDKAQAKASEEHDDRHLNIEDAKTGQAAPTSAAPQERPGVRRTAEMRQLYGAGAPMIHGMETALQMTFDRISDRFQPKLWPNMPLKIVFG